MKLKVLESDRYSKFIHFIRCQRNGLIFEPGSCIDITNPNSGTRKPYSIASSPNEEEFLDLYVRIFESETGVSKYISNLKVGDEIEVGDSVFGYFTPGKDQEDKKYIYIATGTGMAPFISALRYYEHKPHMVLYGVRNMDDMLPGETTHLAISRVDSINHTPKHVSGYFDKLPTDKPDEYTYYVCGLEEMITDTTQYLIEQGVPWDKIQVEQFYYTQY